MAIVLVIKTLSPQHSFHIRALPGLHPAVDRVHNLEALHRYQLSKSTLFVRPNSPIPLFPNPGAIQSLTFALYLTKPFFPECDPPDEAVRVDSWHTHYDARGAK